MALLKDKEDAFDAILSCFMFAFLDLHGIYDYNQAQTPYREINQLWSRFNELEKYHRNNVPRTF